MLAYRWIAADGRLPSCPNCSGIDNMKPLQADARRPVAQVGKVWTFPGNFSYEVVATVDARDNEIEPRFAKQIAV